MCASGDVQIGLMDKKGQLEVEVIRARGLTPKPGSKSLPGKKVPILYLTQIVSVLERRPDGNFYSTMKSIALFPIAVLLI